MVLLIIDTQKLIMNEKLYKFDRFVSNVKELILIINLAMKRLCFKTNLII